MKKQFYPEKFGGRLIRSKPKKYFRAEFGRLTSRNWTVPGYNWHATPIEAIKFALEDKASRISTLEVEIRELKKLLKKEKAK